jgi:hypothetical protein
MLRRALALPHWVLVNVSPSPIERLHEADRGCFFAASVRTRCNDATLGRLVGRRVEAAEEVAAGAGDDVRRGTPSTRPCADRSALIDP